MDGKFTLQEIGIGAPLENAPSEKSSVTELASAIISSLQSANERNQIERSSDYQLYLRTDPKTDEAHKQVRIGRLEEEFKDLKREHHEISKALFEMKKQKEEIHDVDEKIRLQLLDHYNDDRMKHEQYMAELKKRNDEIEEKLSKIEEVVTKARNGYIASQTLFNKFKKNLDSVLTEKIEHQTRLKANRGALEEEGRKLRDVITRHHNQMMEFEEKVKMERSNNRNLINKKEKERIHLENLLQENIALKKALIPHSSRALHYHERGTPAKKNKVSIEERKSNRSSQQHKPRSRSKAVLMSKKVPIELHFEEKLELNNDNEKSLEKDV